MQNQSFGFREAITENIQGASRRLSTFSADSKKSFGESSKTTNRKSIREPGNRVNLIEAQPVEETSEEKSAFYVKLTKRTSPSPVPKISKKVQSVLQAKATAMETLLFGREDLKMKERLKFHVKKLQGQIYYVDPPAFMKRLDPGSATARAYELNCARQEVRQALLQVMESVIGNGSD
ncbi:hypothetical protein AHF37_09544 [Paragonimus kellicotti]|nr:hypothetical protein AHF37_09544 [Paragonimus kellicotti]